MVLCHHNTGQAGNIWILDPLPLGTSQPPRLLLPSIFMFRSPLPLPSSSKNIGWSLQRAKFSHRRQKTCWIQVTFVFLEGVHGKAWVISMKRKEKGNEKRIITFYHLNKLFCCTFQIYITINIEKRQTHRRVEKYQDNIHWKSRDKTSGFWRKYQGWVYDKLKDRQRREKNNPTLRWSCVLKQAGARGGKLI